MWGLRVCFEPFKRHEATNSNDVGRAWKNTATTSQLTERQQRRRQRRHTRAAHHSHPLATPPARVATAAHVHAHVWAVGHKRSDSAKQESHEDAALRLAGRSSVGWGSRAGSEATYLLLHHIKYIVSLITTEAKRSDGGVWECPRTSHTPKKMYYVYVYTK